MHQTLHKETKMLKSNKEKETKRKGSLAQLGEETKKPREAFRIVKDMSPFISMYFYNKEISLSTRFIMMTQLPSLPLIRRFLTYKDEH